MTKKEKSISRSMTIYSIVLSMFIIVALFLFGFNQHYIYVNQTIAEKNIEKVTTFKILLEDKILKPLFLIENIAINAPKDESMDTFIENILKSADGFAGVVVYDQDNEMNYIYPENILENYDEPDLNTIINNSIWLDNGMIIDIESMNQMGKDYIEIIYFHDNLKYVGLLRKNQFNILFDQFSKDSENTVHILDSRGNVYGFEDDYDIYNEDLYKYVFVHKDVEKRFIENYVDNNDFVLTYDYSDKLDWGFILTYSNISMTSEMTRNLFYSFLVAVILFLLSFGHYKFFYRKAFKGLNNFQEQLDKVSDGDFFVKFSPTEYSEFNKVIKSTEMMLSNIKMREDRIYKNEAKIKVLNENLEELVEIRTNQLEKKNYELEKSLKELQNAQKLIVQSEKMASLGKLISGLTREINQPISTSLTMSSLINNQLKRCDEIDDFNNMNKMKVMMLENFQILMNQLMKAMNLIKSFSEITVGVDHDERMEFNLVTHYESLIQSYGMQTENSGIKINFRADDEIIIDSYPGAFTQILTQLMNNAIVHGFSENHSGNINLEVRKVQKKLFIVFTDDGHGMNQEVFDKIYDPFFTTDKSGESMGMGINIISNLVVAVLNGELKFDSKENYGLTCEIIINL
ncbi:MAG: HAMP domain-containing histidine kinase [Clostridiales bacterium]|nr:HAMP domain-containing histidine kinase [Clostridiales bacterium]